MSCWKTLVLLICVGIHCASSLICRTEPDFSSACKFGNLTIVTYNGFTVNPDRCDGRLNITALAQQPTLYINTTNATELFTAMMLDAGPTGTGPYYLHWLVSNLTSYELAHKMFRPNNIRASYQPPSLPKTAGVHQFQIVAFRHNSTLREPVPEVHDVERRSFSMRHWLSDVYYIVKLCGPVAGIQIRTQYDEPTSGGGTVPYVPPGVAPGVHPPPPYQPYPSNPQPPPYQPYPSNPQPPPYINPTTPPRKKGNASLAKPASIIILSLVIFASVFV